MFGTVQTQREWLSLPQRPLQTRKVRRGAGREQSGRAARLRSPRLFVAEAKLELRAPGSPFGPVLQGTQPPGLYTKYSKVRIKKETQPLMV